MFGIQILFELYSFAVLSSSSERTFHLNTFSAVGTTIKAAAATETAESDSSEAEEMGR